MTVAVASSGAVASGVGTVVVVRDSDGGGVSDGHVAASVPAVADTPRSLPCVHLSCTHHPWLYADRSYNANHCCRMPG